MNEIEEPQLTRTSAMETAGAQDESNEEILLEAEEEIPYTYTITSYGADYPVDSLIKRLNTEDVIVPTFRWVSEKDADVVGFQRDYIWPRPKADKFIESLLLGFRSAVDVQRVNRLELHLRIDDLAVDLDGAAEHEAATPRNCI